MVQSLEIRFAFCVRVANKANFLADRGLMEEKFPRIMGEKKKKKKQQDHEEKD